jgi:hypothetical protein
MEYVVVIDPEFGCRQITDKSPNWNTILGYLRDKKPDFVPYDTERTWGKAFDIVGENAHIRAAVVDNEQEGF